MYNICNNQNVNKVIKTNVNRVIDYILSVDSNFINKTFKYLELFNNVYYPNMIINIDEIELTNKIDIFSELISYLEDINFTNKVLIIKRLNDIRYRFEDTKKLNYNDKKFIIDNIENRAELATFLDYIKTKYDILPELRMIYDKYSSILHLILISGTITKSFEINFSYRSQNVELKNDNKIIIYTTNKLINTKSKWLKQMILRYCYFNYILSSSKTPKVLSFFLIDFPKLLYNSGIIGPAEINTGMTNGIYINITRKEESLKTLLHELIHFHDMDFREIPEFINYYLKKRFRSVSDEGYNMKLNLFEAYTECMASIINIMLFYEYSNLFMTTNTEINKKKNYKLFIIHLKNKLSQQINYTFGKCYKLLKFYKCDKLDSCNINQKTNTVSYFFIKSYLYYYLLSFIKCIDLTNARFIECDTSFNFLDKIIKNGFNNDELRKLYYKCNKDLVIKSNNKVKNSKSGDDKSIKMVCIVENIF